MRIALAGISHETNTYCKDMTPASAFHVWRGAKLLELRGQETDVGGAVDACAELNIEPVPLMFANTQPSGIIERDAYESFKEEILFGLNEALQDGLDGCVLLLHGAGVVDGVPDLEADLAASVRDVIGDLPMAASFDLHGNFTQAMTDQLNAVFVCREYPHIDLHTAAGSAVKAVVDMASSGERAECTLLSLPLLLPTTTTFEGAGQALLNQLLSLQEESDAINLSWCHGFPYADVDHVGSFVIASYYPANQARAMSAAKQFAQRLWEARESFRPLSLNAADAVSAAVDAYTQGSTVQAPTANGPVVINETSDNCGGGTPGDGTHLLRAMLDAKLGADACFAFVVDAEVVAAAMAAGVGQTINVELGGKTDDLHGEPLALQAYVKALHDGRLIMQHMFKGMRLNIGPIARLVVDDMDIVVGSRRSQTFDKEPFLAVGIDVMRYKYVALKSSNHFRACFQSIARAIITADPPGLSTHHIEIFPRQNTAKTLWPLDDRAEFLVD